jgi:hypothetical protein
VRVDEGKEVTEIDEIISILTNLQISLSGTLGLFVQSLQSALRNVDRLANTNSD